jgi:hypothetical protein
MSKVNELTAEEKKRVSRSRGETGKAKEEGRKEGSQVKPKGWRCCNGNAEWGERASRLEIQLQGT